MHTLEGSSYRMDSMLGGKSMSVSCCSSTGITFQSCSRHGMLIEPTFLTLSTSVET